MRFSTKLGNVYLGRDERGTDGFKLHLVGVQFGPMLLCVGGLEECFDEWDERHGERIAADDPAIADYDGGIEGALNCGKARVNDGGTLVWVDPYEWVRSFRNGRELRAFLADWR